MLKRLLLALAFIGALLSAQVAHATITLTSTAAAQTVNLTTTTATYTSVAIGTAAADRLVFVALTFVDGDNHIDADPTSVTIGGVTATRAVRANLAGTGASVAYLYWALVTTGTTANIVATWAVAGDGSQDVAMSAYSVTGANTTTPVSATATTATQTTTSGTSGSITVPTNGVLIASGLSFSGNGTTISWTNANQDTQVAGANGENSSAASRTTSGTNAITFANSSGTIIKIEVAVVAIQQAGASAVVPMRARRGYGTENIPRRPANDNVKVASVAVLPRRAA